MTDELELPVPAVEPRPITYEQFLALVPEKFEWVDGYLFDPPYRHNARERLLALLLMNEGLARAVQLAPPQRWREALQQVYGTANRKAARHRSGNQVSRREGQGREEEKG